MAQQAHTEVPTKGHFPPFQTETFASQLFWLAVTFVALYLLIGRLALPRLAGLVEARRSRIESDLAEASRQRKAADAALAAYEQALADARNRAQALANETRDRLNAEAEQTRRALEAKLNARIAEAEQRIAATRAAALTHVQSIATEAAASIVQRLTGISPAGGTVERAVAEALKR
ncbi:MAG TPA: F0F1 ATP synthase subunit B' [Xanthobacteraceae bacterium]|nr:F0F1 ATP synthase subunit B' [Xanthobacteraceae bacterium]